MNMEKSKEEIIESFRNYIETREGRQTSRDLTQKFWQLRKEEKDDKKQIVISDNYYLFEKNLMENILNIYK